MIITKHILIVVIVTMLFSCNKSKFPSLEITKDGVIGWTEKESCNINYVNSDSIVKLTGKIKCRGGMSSKYSKHSFSLELDKKHTFGDLPNDDDWIINATYIDKTFMRHKICYDLYREMNPKNVASKSSYLNVSINNDYEGLYLLMEEVNGGMIGVDKSDTSSMVFKDPNIFREGRSAEVQDTSNYYQQKYPNKKQSDKTYYIERFKNFLFNSSDSLFVKNIDDWVDLENIIDWHIILLFTNNSDGIMKNFYLYKIDQNTPFRIAIWDYDHSLGRDGDNELNMMERELDCNRAILFERLSSIPAINYLPRLQKRWSELRANNIVSIENFEKHIIKNDTIIRSEVKRNFGKWPIDDKWYYDDNDYDQELDLMRKFVILRIKQLDSRFGN